MLHRSRRRATRVGWGAGALLGSVTLLTGCAMVADGSAPDASSATPSPTTTSPTASPSPTPTTDEGSSHVIPECAELISDDEVRESSQEPRYETIEDDAGLRSYALEHLFGPIGAEAFDAAAQTEHCTWGIPNSGSMDMIFVAILTDQERTELEAAFAEDFGATSHLGESVMYEAPPVQGVSTVYRSFWFRDNVWVTHFSPSQAGVMPSQILNRVHQSGAAAGS